FVMTSRREGTPIRAEGDRRKDTCAPRQGAQLASARDIPERDCAVVTSRRESVPIEAVGDRLHPTDVCRQGAQLAPTHYIPELDRFVATSGGQGTTIGAEGDRPNLVGVPCEGVLLASARDVPELDGFLATSGSQGAPIGAEGDRFDPAEILQNELRFLAEGRQRKQSGKEAPRQKSPAHESLHGPLREFLLDLRERHHRIPDSLARDAVKRFSLLRRYNGAF